MPVDADLVVEGWEVERKGRNLLRDGEIRDASGTVLARGKGRFVQIDPGSKLRKELGAARIAGEAAREVKSQARPKGEQVMELMNNNLWRVKVGLAEMLKGGVIMDVTNAEQAKIAEDAGACSVMALERVPSDIRKEGGVARMAAPRVIREIMETVSIPVMAKVRIGHFAEAQVLEALEVDYIDESEVLTPADEEHHVWKHGFKVPFVCGARNLGEALRRIAEGAAMIRTKGEAGSGNIVEAVRHMRAIVGQMKTADDARRGRAGARSERTRRAVRAGRVGGEARQAARAEFLGGRNRHSRRRGARDAARRRSRLRRLGHFQVERSGSSAPAPS